MAALPSLSGHLLFLIVSKGSRSTKYLSFTSHEGFETVS